jgi:hypothetical protein
MDLKNFFPDKQRTTSKKEAIDLKTMMGGIHGGGGTVVRALPASGAHSFGIYKTLVLWDLYANNPLHSGEPKTGDQVQIPAPM